VTVTFQQDAHHNPAGAVIAKGKRIDLLSQNNYHFSHYRDKFLVCAFTSERWRDLVWKINKYNSQNNANLLILLTIS
jgi:hypothetical protein